MEKENYYVVKRECDNVIYDYYFSLEEVFINVPELTRPQILFSIREKQPISGIQIYLAEDYRFVRESVMQNISDFMKEILDMKKRGNRIDILRAINCMKDELREYIHHTKWFIDPDAAHVKLIPIMDKESGFIYPNMRICAKYLGINYRTFRLSRRFQERFEVLEF